jgi:hypothetical protein
MEYLFIVILQLLGVGLQVGWTLFQLDKKFENDTLEEVVNTYWKSDRFPLFISGVILLIDLTVHGVIHVYATTARDWEYNFLVNYFTVAFAISFILGFAGQEILYRYLGKAKEVLLKKADTLEKVLP